MVSLIKLELNLDGDVRIIPLVDRVKVSQEVEILGQQAGSKMPESGQRMSLEIDQEIDKVRHQVAFNLDLDFNKKRLGSDR